MSDVIFKNEYLNKFREQNPEYKDIDDETLADGIYRSNYGNIQEHFTKNKFYSIIELEPAKEETSQDENFKEMFYTDNGFELPDPIPYGTKANYKHQPRNNDGYLTELAKQTGSSVIYHGAKTYRGAVKGANHMANHVVNMSTNLSELENDDLIALAKAKGINIDESKEIDINDIYKKLEDIQTKEDEKKEFKDYIPVPKKLSWEEADEIVGFTKEQRAKVNANMQKIHDHLQDGNYFSAFGMALKELPSILADSSGEIIQLATTPTLFLAVNARVMDFEDTYIKENGKKPPSKWYSQAYLSQTLLLAYERTGIKKFWELAVKKAPKGIGIPLTIGGGAAFEGAQEFGEGLSEDYLTQKEGANTLLQLAQKPERRTEAFIGAVTGGSLAGVGTATGKIREKLNEDPQEVKKQKIEKELAKSLNKSEINPKYLQDENTNNIRYEDINTQDFSQKIKNIQEDVNNSLDEKTNIEQITNDDEIAQSKQNIKKPKSSLDSIEDGFVKLQEDIQNSKNASVEELLQKELEVREPLQEQTFQEIDEINPNFKLVGEAQTIYPTHANPKFQQVKKQDGINANLNKLSNKRIKKLDENIRYYDNPQKIDYLINKALEKPTHKIRDEKSGYNIISNSEHKNNPTVFVDDKNSTKKWIKSAYNLRDEQLQRKVQEANSGSVALQTATSAPVSQYEILTPQNLKSNNKKDTIKDFSKADIISTLQKNRAVFQERPYTKQEWDKLFPNNRINTPIGEIVFGKNQFEKLDPNIPDPKNPNRKKQDRRTYLDYIYKTLSKPTYIIKTDNEFAFIKEFLKDDQTTRIHSSIVVEIDNLKINITNYHLHSQQMLNKIKKADEVIVFSPFEGALLPEEVTTKQSTNPTPTSSTIDNKSIAEEITKSQEEQNNDIIKEYTKKEQEDDTITRRATESKKSSIQDINNRARDGILRSSSTKQTRDSTKTEHVQRVPNTNKRANDERSEEYRPDKSNRPSKSDKEIQEYLTAQDEININNTENSLPHFDESRENRSNKQNNTLYMKTTKDIPRILNIGKEVQKRYIDPEKANSQGVRNTNELIKSNIIKDAQILPKPLNEKEFIEQFRTKDWTSVETPYKKVRFKVEDAWKHIDKGNTYKKDRTYISGAFKKLLEDPLLIVDNKAREQIEYYAPFVDPNNPSKPIHLISIAKNYQGRLNLKTFFEIEHALNRVRNIINSEDRDIKYFKYSSSHTITKSNSTNDIVNDINITSNFPSDDTKVSNLDLGNLKSNLNTNAKSITQDNKKSQDSNDTLYKAQALQKNYTKENMLNEEALKDEAILLPKPINSYNDFIKEFSFDKNTNRYFVKTPIGNVRVKA